MDPTSSPDNTRPAPGLARFWQVRPDADGPAPAAYPAGEDAEMVALGSRRKPEPPETPADLLAGYVRPAAPIPPATPVPPVAQIPIAQVPQAPSADPFGLNRAARRSGQRHPAGGRPFSGPPARDPDHSVPTDDQPAPAQDVKSQEPEAGGPAPSRDGAFGGFRLGGTGRFLFGGRAPAAAEAGPAPESAPELPEAQLTEARPPEAQLQEAQLTEAPVAEVAEPGDSLVAEKPDGDEPSGATPADGPAAETPPDADQDAADRAGPSDENGREDMNGRAGAPGYAQTGEASGPDGQAAPGDSGDNGEEKPAAAAGWATVPSANHPVTPTSGSPAAGPVSGAPVSPGFAYPPAQAFTPDHPPLEPVSGAPHADAPEPVAEPAADAPTSGAPVSSATAAAIQYPTVQIPATRTPPDLTADRSSETVALPPAADGGYGFGASGYSLGRSGEAFGVASVTPAAPGVGSVTPPPAEFTSFPFPDSGVTGLSVGGARRGGDENGHPPAHRSASLEDVEPVRRAARRATPDEEPATYRTEVARTVWDEDAARHFRAAWHEVKAEFVDDPVNALTRAHDLLTDAVNELTEVLLAERDDLDPLRGTDTPDTESMRMAMRNYREFLERILSL
ncbi:hypothetical protein AB0F72_23970 [Actinoplanes sp. NPDC023936]|uniref:hypothetical protein n=1 Tax=Actinoplanes sp. NPDC023936 TaxID=3154910 RepID=UPI0033C61E40